MSILSQTIYISSIILFIELQPKSTWNNYQPEAKSYYPMIYTGQRCPQVLAQTMNPTSLSKYLPKKEQWLRFPRAIVRQFLIFN